VSDFYAAGMVSAKANRRYGSLPAVQQRYAPFGRVTDLCVGLASVAQNEGLTLSPCSVPGTTVWIVHEGLATPSGYFPIINAATTDFRRPFAMHLPRNDLASGKRCRCRPAACSSSPARRRCRRGSSGALSSAS
jgi:hypothetical protein